jgi:hypothetical protein
VSTRSRKRKQGKGGGGKGGGGALRGLRSGFKRAAAGAAGDAPARGSRVSSTIWTIVILLAAAAIVYLRRR